MHHGAEAALRVGHFAKSGQAQRLGGLGDVVQVGVQQLHETGKVGADFFLAPAYITVQLVRHKVFDQA